jgi:hypothetical protein
MRNPANPALLSLNNARAKQQTGQPLLTSMPIAGDANIHVTTTKKTTHLVVPTAMLKSLCILFCFVLFCIFSLTSLLATFYECFVWSTFLNIRSQFVPNLPWTKCMNAKSSSSKLKKKKKLFSNSVLNLRRVKNTATLYIINRVHCRVHERLGTGAQIENCVCQCTEQIPRERMLMPCT